MRSASPRSFRFLLALVVVGAGARLALQILAMPAYAGLDEIFHVARFSFLFEEGHHPGLTEPSVAPRYIASVDGRPGFPPDFAYRAHEWPARVHDAPFPDPLALSGTIGPASRTNYEAQQASFAYALLAPLERFLAPRTLRGELMLLRWAAVACALLAVFATAWLAGRLFGRTGLLAAALLCSTPTWLALVARAGNDAVACGFVSLAIALEFSRRESVTRTVAEGLAWAAAFGAKLTAWPAAVVVGLRGLRAGNLFRWRNALLLVLVGAAAFATLADLRQRTGVAVGSQSFTAAVSPSDAPPEPFDLGASLRILVASFIWPGAQHGNALRPLGMLLFVAPLAGISFLGLLRARKSARLRRLQLLGWSTLLAFAVAQGVNAAGFVARARQAGKALSIGGFEGWYVYTLAIVWFGILLASAFRGLVGRPALLGSFVVWMLGWDLAIHEGALFRDYAGLTSAAAPSLFFRWSGPGSTLQMFERLSIVGASHSPAYLLAGLRLVHLSATLMLLFLVLGRFRSAAPLRARADQR